MGEQDGLRSELRGWQDGLLSKLRGPLGRHGGLQARGHPLAASGLAMVHEIVTQLRGEAAARQVARPGLGLVHNAGGLIGLDEALCGVAIFAGP